MCSDQLLAIRLVSVSRNFRKTTTLHCWVVPVYAKLKWTTETAQSLETKVTSKDHSMQLPWEIKTTQNLL